MKTFGALAALTFALALAATLSGCGGGSTAGNPNSPPIEDTSASGAAAAAVGGALSGTSGSASLSSAKESIVVPTHSATASVLRDVLTLEPSASATTYCPTTLTSDGLGCTASGDDIWLTFQDCSYGGNNTYAGVLEIISSKTSKCATLDYPGANGSLIRQYVKGSAPTTPDELLVTSSFGTAALVDDATANLANFNGDTIPPFANVTGYGTIVDFGSNGARSGIAIGHHLEINSGTDESIYGSVTITESPGATSRVVTGQLTVYHNILKVIATSTFENVTHEDGCCLPISGVISTTFAAGSVAPTSAGEAAVGKTETLTLTGCGTGTLQTYEGQTESVTLSRCF